MGTGERLVGHPDQRREGIRLGHRQVGQHLAVDLDLGTVETGNEPAVARPVEAGRRVDPLDPELAEVALTGTAVPVGVLHRVHDLLVGSTERTALVAVVTLCLLEDGAMVLLGVYCTLDSGHGTTPFRMGPDRPGGERRPDRIRMRSTGCAGGAAGDLTNPLLTAGTAAGHRGPRPPGRSRPVREQRSPVVHTAGTTCRAFA